MTTKEQVNALEMEGIQRTKVRDWPGARQKFLEAYAAADTPVLRVETLRNVAGAYGQEGDQAGLDSVVRQALKIIADENMDVPLLKEDLERLRDGRPASLPRFAPLAAFFGGVYIGIAYPAGGVLGGSPFVLLIPVIPCFGLSLSYFPGQAGFRVGLAMTAIYGFGLMIGYGLAKSGLIQFGYR